MQLEEINGIGDVCSTRFKRRKGIISRIFKTLYNQFSFKILGIQCTLFIFLCISFQEGYNGGYIEQIKILTHYTKYILNYLLGFISLLLFIRLTIGSYKYFYNMIKNNGDVSGFFLKEKPYYILLVSGLLQIAISRIIIRSSFNTVHNLNINIMKDVSRSSYISLFLLLITLGHGVLNILLGFFSIKTKPYRTNYLLGPIILILIFIIYLNYLA